MELSGAPRTGERFTPPIGLDSLAVDDELGLPPPFRAPKRASSLFFVCAMASPSIPFALVVLSRRESAAASSAWVLMLPTEKRTFFGSFGVAVAWLLELCCPPKMAFNAARTFGPLSLGAAGSGERTRAGCGVVGGIGGTAAFAEVSFPRLARKAMTLLRAADTFSSAGGSGLAATAADRDRGGSSLVGSGFGCISCLNAFLAISAWVGGGGGGGGGGGVSPSMRCLKWSRAFDACVCGRGGGGGDGGAGGGESGFRRFTTSAVGLGGALTGSTFFGAGFAAACICKNCSTRARACDGRRSRAAVADSWADGALSALFPRNFSSISLATQAALFCGELGGSGVRGASSSTGSGGSGGSSSSGFVSG